MKQIYIISLFFLPFWAFSQLYVIPKGNVDSYLYAEGGMIFVQKGIHLQKNPSPTIEASIFLRNESQLLQGEESAYNSGNGMLSVFQEGNATQFTYNYWSSPVQNVLAGSQFGNIFYEPLTRTHSRKAEITSGYEGKADPLTISNRWIYKLSGQGYIDWVYVGNNFIVSAGEGFTMKGVEGTNTNIKLYGVENNPGNEQRYDFRGRPHTGTIELNISQGEILLTGNPYPSAIDLNAFLLENTTITGIAYFWDSKPVSSHYLQDYEGGYGAYSPVLGDEGYVPAVFKKYDNHGITVGETGNIGDYYSRRFTPIGQGFIVEGLSNGKIFFKNKHRLFRKENPAQSQFRASVAEGTASENIPMFRLNVEFKDKYTRQLLLAVHPDATIGVDRAMDAKNLSLQENDAGWLFGYEEYLINIIPNLKSNIPLSISSKSETDVTVRLAEQKKFDPDIFLWDSVLDIYYNLKNQEITLHLPSGGYHEQFYITFNKKVKEVEEKEGEKEEDVQNKGILYPREYKIFQNNPFNRTEIFSPEGSSPVIIGIYNLNGRKVREIKADKNEDYHEISTSHLTKGMYIIKIITREGTIVSKKVIISN